MGHGTVQVIPPLWGEIGAVGTLGVEWKGLVWAANVVQAPTKWMGRQQAEKLLGKLISFSKATWRRPINECFLQTKRTNWFQLLHSSNNNSIWLEIVYNIKTTKRRKTRDIYLHCFYKKTRDSFDHCERVHRHKWIVHHLRRDNQQKYPPTQNASSQPRDPYIHEADHQCVSNKDERQVN